MPELSFYDPHGLNLHDLTQAMHTAMRMGAPVATKPSVYADSEGMVHRIEIDWEGQE